MVFVVMEGEWCLWVWRVSGVCGYGGRVVFVVMEGLWVWRVGGVCGYGGRVVFVVMEGEWCLWLCLER